MDDLMACNGYRDSEPCGWTGTRYDCHQLGFRNVCPKCGGEAITLDELSAPPLIETQVDMAAVERLERMAVEA